MLLAFSFPFAAVLKFIWAVTGTSIFGGVGALVVKGLKLLHINISQSQQDQLIQIVVDAVHYAEEAGATGQLSSAQKLTAAMAYVRTHGATLVTTITQEQLSQLIKSVLVQQGLGAASK